VKATRKTPAERLADGLERKPNGCLEWTKQTDHKGYGRIKVDGKMLKTHRFAWTLANGPIPEGMSVLHHCDNRLCADTEKCLFLGTKADNNADMKAKGRYVSANKAKTECTNGHEYTEANTYVTPRGNRHCKTCHSIQAAAYYAKRKAGMNEQESK
jgi:HNH endonuclease